MQKLFTIKVSALIRKKIMMKNKDICGVKRKWLGDWYIDLST